MAAGTGRGGRVRRWEGAQVRLLSLLTLAAAWEWFGQTADPRFFPPLSRVLGAWAELAGSGELAGSLAVSLQALALGFVLSAGMGIPLGLLMGRYRALQRALDPYVTALLAVPMISFIPLLVIALGLGLASRTAVVFLFAFVIIAVNATAGVRQADPSLVEMARSFGARERDLFLKVIVPAALPAIIAGLRLGMARAVVGMITGEMVLAVVGFGALLMTFGASFETPKLFATILTVILVAVVLLEGVHLLDRRLLPWRARQG